MTLRSSISSASVAFLLTGLCPVPVPAQTPTFRVEARVVEVPVVVRDRKTGQAVKGLTAEDFVITENGKLQRIEYCGSHTSSSQLDMPVAASKTPGKTPPGLYSNRRSSDADAPPIVAVLIDGYNARYEQQYDAAKSAAEIIARADERSRWSVYFLGRLGVRVLHDYSTDTASLVRRLRGLRSGGDHLAGLGAGDGDLDPAPVEKLNANHPSDDEIMRMRVTLSALRDIGRHLSALPGRKSLVWMTTGISMSAVILNESALWSSTLQVLNDANVAVYSVDSAGMRAPSRYLAENPTRGPRAIPGSRGGGGTPREAIEVLETLSAETGGQTFKNSNNLGAGFSQAIADSHHFYRLTYRTTNQKWDGRFIPIQVKVPGRSGLEIRHRAGYYARPLAPVTAPARDRLLAEAMISPLDAVEVGLIAQLAPNAGSQESILRLTVQPGTGRPGEAGSYQGHFDVRFVQSSVEAKVLDDVTDEVDLNLKPPQAERAYEDGFTFDRALRIHPSARTLKIGFCDHETGKIGSLRIQLPVVSQ